MNEDPIFSKEAFKAALLLVVAIVIGGGAYAVATGNLNLELPDVDLPETEPSADPTITLSDTNLSNTTIDPTAETGAEPEVEPAEAPVPEQPVSPAGFTAPFTQSSFIAAISQVGGEVGTGAELTRLFVNDVQTQFIVRTGGQDVKAYGVLIDDGSLITQDASISITGNATIDDFSFKLAAALGADIDKMLGRAKKLSGKADFRPSVISLERDLSARLKPPEWTLNAEAGGNYVMFKARLDGSGVKKFGGGPTPIPQAALDARKLNDCISEADSDSDAISACFDEFSP